MRRVKEPWRLRRRKESWRLGGIRVKIYVTTIFVIISYNLKCSLKAHGRIRGQGKKIFSLSNIGEHCEKVFVLFDML